jgi:hypothetical protein
MRWIALLLLLGGCAARDLDRMKDLDARGDWAMLAAFHLSECDNPRDAICAEAQFLRARGCARLASGHLSESDRRRFLDCAVEGTRAALAASAATAPAERTAWREAYAAALFARRQALPSQQACADNAALLTEADRLRAEAPAVPRSRFLAASARLTAARLCGAPACPTLAEAGPLLRDPPAEAAAQWRAQWRALSVAIETTARSLSC